MFKYHINKFLYSQDGGDKSSAVQNREKFGSRPSHHGKICFYIPFLEIYNYTSTWYSLKFKKISDINSSEPPFI